MHLTTSRLLLWTARGIGFSGQILKYDLSYFNMEEYELNVLHQFPDELEI